MPVAGIVAVPPTQVKRSFWVWSLLTYLGALVSLARVLK